MDRLLKKLFLDHYMKKHRAIPALPFDDCFPGAGRCQAARLGVSLIVGMAASVMLLLGALLFYQGLTGSGQAGAGNNMLAGLQKMLEKNAVLALSQSQGVSLKRELEQFAWPADDAMQNDFDETRLALLESLLKSPALDLDSHQAIAMTGLLSSWKPDMAGMPGNGYGWIDDVALSHYVADCSSHCHQADLSGDYGSARLRNYLLDCLNARRGSGCAGTSPATF